MQDEPYLDQSFSRRKLLVAGVQVSAMPLRPVFSAQRERSQNRLKVAIFSKHLRFLEGEALAQASAEIGFDDIDVTVRKGGHIEPERVKHDLPQLAARIRRYGLGIPMLTTDIVDAHSPYTEDILNTMLGLGIRYYRWGGLRYHSDTPIATQIEQFKPRLAELSALNSRYQVCGMYHTHSGVSLVGAPIWDLHILFKDADPNLIGVNYDIGHATIEGGLGGWIDSFRIILPRIRGIAVKDFIWSQGANKNWQPRWVPLGEGMVHFEQFFAMVANSRFSGPLQLHFEYPLGGAETGNPKVQISAQEVFSAMRRDLNQLRTYLS